MGTAHHMARLVTNTHVPIRRAHAMALRGMLPGRMPRMAEGGLKAVHCLGRLLGADYLGFRQNSLKT